MDSCVACGQPAPFVVRSPRGAEIVCVRCLGDAVITAGGHAEVVIRG